MAGTAVRVSKARARPESRVPLAGSRFGRKVRRNLSAHGFLIGAVLCFALFSWWPMIREVIMSFSVHELRG